MAAALMMCMMASGAIAQDYTPMPPSENVALAKTPVVPWDRFCQKLTAYQPGAGVDYQPETDVRGRRVAAADLPAGAAFNLPREYRMFITSDQADKLGVTIPGTPLNSDMLVGEIQVNADGRVSFNGQPLQSDQVYALCGKIR